MMRTGEVGVLRTVLEEMVLCQSLQTGSVGQALRH